MLKNDGVWLSGFHWLSRKPNAWHEPENRRAYRVLFSFKPGGGFAIIDAESVTEVLEAI